MDKVSKVGRFCFGGGIGLRSEINCKGMIVESIRYSDLRKVEIYLLIELHPVV
jgi:hypothetical protein